MESFYGGKQGASFTIKETFNSVEEMEIAFRGGDTYKKVAYGEHVLIAGDELNEEYGNVYRRGYDEAELVGNFRGPQGTPFKFQGKYDATKTYYNNLRQIDLVYFNGETYIRIGDADSVSGISPEDPEVWSAFVEGGEAGNIYINPNEEEEVEEIIETFPSEYVTYNNSDSDLDSTTVKEALDEISDKIENIKDIAGGVIYDNATHTKDGLMSKSDKSKLDGIEAGANNYTHPGSGVTAGTYKSVTVNEKGHVTSGTNPTTLEGYGITDAEAKGTASSAVSAHDTSTSAHNDIRDLINGLTTRLNTLADSDDTTLDQMSEIVAYIKSNKTLIESVTTTKVNVSDIVDNLTTNVSNKPLSAAQGVAIKNLIDTLQTEVNAKAKASDLTSHTDNKSNPHGVTKSQVGLGNVPNVATNDQTPTYTVASSNSALTSGEKLSVAFGKIAKAISSLISHLANTSNPHSVTKTQVGLGNVENKSSETIRGELTKANVTNALGYTPPTTDTKYTHPTTSGNKHIPSGGSSGQILRWSADGTAVWGNESGGAVSGVKGNAENSYRTGNVNITPTNIGLGNVNNTSDVNKPISTATQTALDKKPENVSELFNFNIYNGDISTLAVGMYVYHNGVTYAGNGSTSTTGSVVGWCKIGAIYEDTGYCQLNVAQLFGKQSNAGGSSVVNYYCKTETIKFILTAEEAKYLGMLSSVWGATQGGLTFSPVKFRTLGTPAYSISFSMPSDATYIALVNVHSNDSYNGSCTILFTRGYTSAGGGSTSNLGSTNYTLINKSDGFGAGISYSGGTVTINYGSVMTAYAFYY